VAQEIFGVTAENGNCCFCGLPPFFGTDKTDLDVGSFLVVVDDVVTLKIDGPIL
jgi:hypothetical protein